MDLAHEYFTIVANAKTHICALKHEQCRHVMALWVMFKDANRGFVYKRFYQLFITFPVEISRENEYGRLLCFFHPCFLPQPTRTVTTTGLEGVVRKRKKGKKEQPQAKRGRGGRMGGIVLEGSDEEGMKRK